MRRLREEADDLEIEADEDEEMKCLRDQVAQHVDAIKMKHRQWKTYPPMTQGAVILLSFANESSGMEWKSNLFKTKLLIALLKDDLRARESGGYERVGKVWQPSGEGFSAAVVEHLENRTKTAMGMIAFRIDDLDKETEDGRHTLFREIAESEQVKSEAKRWLIVAQKKLKTGDEEGWCTAILSQLATLYPSWSKGESTYSNFCKWGFTPRPPNNGFFAFKDCALCFGENGVKQKLKEELADVRMYIPESLAYKPSDEYIEWFRKYFATTIAGDMEVMTVEFAIESLAMRGLRLPHHCVIYYGKGGNSKGARSRLRAKCFAAGRKWVSPGVFDKAVRDEFRKQGREFYGATLCTIREADEFDFDEKVFRAWSAGEGSWDWNFVQKLFIERQGTKATTLI